jgi:dienelactone hydrolase
VFVDETVKVSRWFVLVCLVSLAACIGAFAAPATASSSRATKTASRIVETNLTVHRAAEPHDMNVLVIRPARRGSYPLVVFAHGYRGSVLFYRPWLDALAASGYVVAAPTFPDTNHAAQPADLSLAIDELTGSASPLPEGLVDAEHIAVAGHSLGGADALGIAYNSCCRDPRVTAVLAFEPAPVEFPGGQYTWRGAPLLMVIGSADPLVPTDAGEQALANFRRGIHLVTINGGVHGGGLHHGDPGYGPVQRAIRRFLAAYLRDDGDARRALPRSMTIETATTRAPA